MKSSKQRPQEKEGGGKIKKKLSSAKRPSGLGGMGQKEDIREGVKEPGPRPFNMDTGKKTGSPDTRNERNSTGAMRGASRIER